METQTQKLTKSETFQTEEAKMKKKNDLRQNEDFDEEVGDPLFVLEERGEECMECQSVCTEEGVEQYTHQGVEWYTHQVQIPAGWANRIKHQF